MKPKVTITLEQLRSIETVESEEPCCPACRLYGGLDKNEKDIQPHKPDCWIGLAIKKAVSDDS